MQSGEEQAELGWLACDGTSSVAKAVGHCAECPIATTAAIAAVVATCAGNRRSGSRVSTLRGLPTDQLDEFV